MNDKVDISQTVMPPDEEPGINIGEYQARLAAAKDTNEFLAVVTEIAKQKSAIAKAQADTMRKEAEALAGDREKLSVAIHKAVAGVVDATKLEAVKAKGFTFKLDEVIEGVPTTYKAVALLVPTVKTRKTGGGGAAGISTADQTGISLSELVDQYANDEEKAELAAVLADTSLTDKAKNSKAWQVRTKAKKRILVDNPNLIKK